MSQPLVERYKAQIAGTLSCYDRMVVTGTLPHVCYPEGMTHYLHTHDIPLFAFPAFAEGLRERVRERAEVLAAEAGIAIEYISHRVASARKRWLPGCCGNAGSIQAWCT